MSILCVCTIHHARRWMSRNAVSIFATLRVSSSTGSGGGQFTGCRAAAAVATLSSKQRWPLKVLLHTQPNPKTLPTMPSVAQFMPQSRRSMTPSSTQKTTRVDEPAGEPVRTYVTVAPPPPPHTPPPTSSGEVRQPPLRAITGQYLHLSKVASIVGMPMFQGQELHGVERGPDAIRQGPGEDSCLAERITREGWLVEDAGNVRCADAKDYPSTDTNAKNHNLIGNSLRSLYEHTRISTTQGKFCLTLGGDHSVAIGSVAGILAARPETGIIWMDAHADINTPAQSLSKNIHGMALAFLMHLFEVAQLPGWDWLDERFRLLPQRLVFIGLRDVDDAEKEVIRSLGIKTFTMHDVDRMGIGQTMERALEHLIERRVRPLHLSLDIDCVDPVFAAATGTTVRGGLSYREAFYAVESISSTGLLTSMDIVEVNPALADPSVASETVDVAFRLVLAALGNRII